MYRLSDTQGGWRLVQYEGLKYLTQNQLKLPEKISLHEAAAFSMEHHPEYFGTYPAPIITPAGYTLRYKKLNQGIYWLETDLCKRMMAVCYPIWSTELSDTALSLGQQTEHDRENGIDNTLGYLFFSEQSSCIPLFELLRYRRSRKRADCINRAALMNAIWCYFPEYATAYNLREQSGANDSLGLIMKSLGVDAERKRSDENMLTVTPEADTNFICW